MPGPKTSPCGGTGQPACPPVPAAVTDEPAQYTLSDMEAHGELNYRKGRADERMIPHPGDK